MRENSYLEILVKRLRDKESSTLKDLLLKEMLRSDIFKLKEQDFCKCTMIGIDLFTISSDIWIGLKKKEEETDNQSRLSSPWKATPISSIS